MVEQDLVAYIKTSTAITDLVGTGIFALFPSQSASLPYVVITRVSTGRDRTLTGKDNFPKPLFQLECVAADYLGAKELAAAVDDLLNAGGPHLSIVSTTLVNEIDGFEVKTRLHRVIQDYRVIYSDT